MGTSIMPSARRGSSLQAWVPGGNDPVPESVDYFVAMTRLNTHDTFAQIPLVHRIGRRGAPFSEIHAW